MNRRTLMILSLLFVVLLVVGVLPRFSASKAERVRNVRDDVRPPAALKAADVVEIEISDATETILLRRGEKGWVFPAKFDAPVNSQRADELAGVFSEIDKAERVADSTRMDVQFGLDPVKAKRLRFMGAQSKVLLDLVVGTVDQAGDRSFNDAGNYLRVTGTETVWTHSKKLQHLVYPKASYWLDNRLFPSIEPKDVAELVGKVSKIQLEFDDLPPPGSQPESQPETVPTIPPDRLRLVMTAKEEDVPVVASPSGPKVDENPSDTKPTTKKERRYQAAEPYQQALLHTPMVDNLARLLLFARCDDIAGTDPSLAQFGFDRPSVSIELTFADGTVRSMKVGAKAPPSDDPVRKNLVSRYASVAGDSKVFLLSDFTVAQFRKKLADLKPPEPVTPKVDGLRPIEIPDDSTTRPGR